MTQKATPMQKNVWLFLILILPIFFFLFLYTFGTNRYNLPIYYGLDSTQVNGKWQVKYHTLPAFMLTNQYGERFTRKSIAENKVYIVDFFFTKCGNPTLCPQMSKELARVQEMFAKNDKVMILSHTVDPDNDTPEVLQKYAEKHGAIKGKWHFLTGLKKDIYDLAYHGYKINAGEEKNTVTPEFLHATKFMLVDGKGRIRGYYDGLEPKDVDRLVTEVNVLLYDMKIER